MCDLMSFPATVEEFMEQYKIVDREEVYTNGAEMVPIFRMKQWFEHEELKKAPTALDHIHNVVSEREYQRGYKQAKEEYDHKLTVIKSRIKDHYYNKGYKQGKADANCPEIPDSCNVETVEAIPVPWIESYALLAEADGRPFFAEGIRDMVEEWKRDRKVD